MEIRNLIGHNGNSIKNQFVITDKHGNTYFQSYGKIIAKIDTLGKITLDEKYWDYSATTRRNRNLFLALDSKEIKIYIRMKKITFTNLNKKKIA